jgi:hypothetical protein
MQNESAGTGQRIRQPVGGVGTVRLAARQLFGVRSLVDGEAVRYPFRPVKAMGTLPVLVTPGEVFAAHYMRGFSRILG